MADEFKTPKEFTTPSEFPEVKEVYVTTPEFLDRPVGYGTTGQKSKSGKSRAAQLRKMMMYLATIVTTMGSLLMFSSSQADFDKKQFFVANPDWYNPQDDEYIYLGKNGYGWIAERTVDGEIRNDFYYYRRLRYDIEDGGTYDFTACGYEIDWSRKVIDGKKVTASLKVVESDEGYVVQASSPDNPSETKTLVPVDPSKTNYPGKQYMLKYVEMPMQEILNEFGTYIRGRDAPVYEYIFKITFGPEGTGTFLINGKEEAFTYTIDEDLASNFITITYKGRTARGCIDFYAEKPTLMFFGGLEGFPGSFAPFIAVDPSEADEIIAGQKSVDNGGSTDKRGDDKGGNPDEGRNGSADKRATDAAECLRQDTDWYCREIDAYIHIGRNGEGFIFAEKNDEEGAYYKRMTFTAQGSVCICQVENFNFPSFNTMEYTIECFTTSHGYELLVKKSGDEHEHVYEEYPSKLNDYMVELVGKNTDDILMKIRNFHINDYGVKDDSFTHLEFTTRDAGYVTASGERHQFRYEIVESGINTTFYLYYKDQKYLGRLHFAKGEPGIQLFNPWNDGTFGPFRASENP